MPAWVRLVIPDVRGPRRSTEGALPGVSIAAAAAWETEDVRSVPADEVGDHGDLHPGLQATWPTLSEAIGVREPR